MRINHEFDIPSVWAWGTNPQIYIDAWKRIVGIFRSENLQNVKWLWSPNFNSEGNVRFADYYPGDENVDLVGITLYANNWGWSGPAEMLNARGIDNQNPVCPYQFALDHHKPFAIAEWGLNISAGMTDEQNAVWLNEFFGMVENNSNIKMMIHWGGYDWFLLNNPTAVQVYKSYVDDQRVSSHYP